MATFRLRRPDGGSALRGGDGLRAPDKNVYEYTAAGGIVFGGAAVVSTIKAVTGAGGIVFGGEADIAVTRSYPAAGGIEYGGAADTQFVSAAAPADQGGGSYVPRRAGIPIRRRQYGDPFTFEYVASGGIRFGGSAETSHARHSAAYQATPATGGIRHGGAASTEIYSPEEEILILLLADDDWPMAA